MPKKPLHLVELNKKAVRVRESGDLVKSRKLFEALIKRIKILGDSSNEEEVDIYYRIVGEWIIQLRLESKKLLNEALSQAKKIYDLLAKEDLKSVRVIRGVSNTLIDAGDFENAEKYLRGMLVLINEKRDSARAGDVKAHLGLCLYRTGRQKEALEMVEKALKDIEANTGNASSLEIAVWKSHALKVKSMLLLRSPKNKSGALKIAKEAYEIAKRENVVQRMKEAKNIIDYISKI